MKARTIIRNAAKELGCGDRSFAEDESAYRFIAHALAIPGSQHIPDHRRVALYAELASVEEMVR